VKSVLNKLGTGGAIDVVLESLGRSPQDLPYEKEKSPYCVLFPIPNQLIF
jgi:hypothetical protein